MVFGLASYAPRQLGNSITMLINYIQVYVIHLTQLTRTNLHTNRFLLSPVYVCITMYTI